MKCDHKFVDSNHCLKCGWSPLEQERQMTKELIEHMLTSLETPHKELTKWEEDFLGSIGEQFKSRGTLSEKQTEILERIYSEKTA